MRITSSKRGFSYYLIPFQPLTEIRGLCVCAPLVFPPFLLSSPLLPPSPLLPWSPFLPRESDRGGSSPLWLWPEAKSPRHSCTLIQLAFLNEKGGRDYPSAPRPIPNAHIYIKTCIAAIYSPQFLSTYLKSTSPSFPLNVNSITYCIFLPASLHNLIVQQCKSV